jgi:hypothetical protein
LTVERPGGRGGKGEAEGGFMLKSSSSRERMRSPMSSMEPVEESSSDSSMRVSSAS